MLIRHLTTCSCCGGGEIDPFATRFTAVGFEAEVLGYALRSLEDGADAGSGGDTPSEPGTDAFAAQEDELTALLASTIHDSYMPLREKLEHAVKVYGDDLARVSAALEDIAGQAEDPWSKDVETQTKAILAEAIKAGTTSQKAAPPRSATPKMLAMGPLSKDPQTLTLHQGIVSAARYSTNNFFNTFVIPAVMEQAEKIRDAAGPLDAPDLSPILGVLDARLRSVPYWNIVANAAASRGYHYGLMRNAQIAGRKTYTYQAVVDRRTSAVCLFLNGKVFSVDEAVAMMDWIATAETTAEIKRIAPWPKLADIKDMSNHELEIRGYAVPPLHGRCRSTARIQ